MRVLFATESYYPNIDGGAVARRNLAVKLRDKGHEVAVVAPGLRAEDYKEEHDDITIYRMSGRTLPIYTDYKFCVFPMHGVRRAINDFQPDVIDINTTYQIGLCALQWAKKKGIPTIGTVHVLPENMLLSVHKTKFLFNVLERLAWFYIINFFNRCDYVTAPTQTAIDILQSHGLRVEAVPISCGIDLDVFKPGGNGDTLRRDFSIPEKPVVLYTGRISGEKRIDVLIRAAPAVLDRVDAHFVICGEGREKQNLQELADKLGITEHVTFTGFLVNEVFPDIYNLADLFVMPSESELQSIVTLEALASGLPVVAANKHALPELVKNPENGYLYQPDDTRGLAGRITEILTDTELMHRMGAMSLKLIQKHSLEKTISRFETIYRETIDSHNSRKAH